MNAVQTDLPNTLRDGRYILGDVVGEGGMAVVVVAHDRDLGVDRAVKILTTSSRERTAIRRRLKAEARAMARLQHPNILAIHDVGMESDMDYVVMDLAEGGSLQDVLREGPLEVEHAIRCMVQVLSALASAHAAGIVHRDVKPHNILLDHSGRALLADFGIALLSDDERRTQTGVAMGSVAYMPPEQRLDAARVGPAADIYAAGSTLYALLTGENPVDLFLARPTSARWTAVPELIRPLLLKACDQDPPQRWRNAAEMASALAALLESPSLDTVAAIPPAVSRTRAPAGATHPPTQGANPTAEALSFLEHNVTRSPTGLELAAGLQSKVDAELDGSALPARVPTRVPTAMPPAPPREEPESNREAVYWSLATLLLLLLFCVFVGWHRLGDGAAAPLHGTDVKSPPPAVSLYTDPVPAPEPPPSPEPEPASAPTPSPVPVTPSRPTPRPEPAPAPLDGAEPAGKWHGTIGGIVVDLTVSGPAGNMRGSITSTARGATATSAIRGKWHATSRRLFLADIDASQPSAARYELSLDETSTRMTGQVLRHIGGVRQLVLVRVK